MSDKPEKLAVQAMKCLARGERHFESHIKCAKCGSHTRCATSLKCLPCRRASSLAYARANKEKMRKNSKEWHYKNREYVSMSHKARRLVRKEQAKQQGVE